MHFGLIKITYAINLYKKGVITSEEVALTIVKQIGYDIVASNEYGVPYNTQHLADLLLNWLKGHED